MGQKVTKQKLSVFHNAVRNGNTAKVKELIETGAPLDDQDDVFGTALHEAVCFDRLEIAELLIEHKEDVNTIQRPHGDTPLCVASRKGYIQHIELLIKHHAKINLQGKDGSTPLHCALENKHENVAQFLVGAGANVNILDSNGMSSLHVACKNLCKQSIELILNNPENLSLSPSSSSRSVSKSLSSKSLSSGSLSSTLNSHDKFNMTPLMYLCKEGDLQLVEFLLKSGAKTRYENGKSAPLHVTSNLEIAKILIANGADVNARDEIQSTPLHYAATDINGTLLVQLFIENRADPSTHDAPPTSTSSGAHYKSSHHGDVISGRSTPLHCACACGALANAETLLEKGGADVAARDFHKNTPLHVACKMGYSAIAQMLTSHGADPEAVNADGLTPAQLALISDD